MDASPDPMNQARAAYARAVEIAGGNRNKLAKFLDISAAAVMRWDGVFPVKQAILFEEKTGGKLTRWDLRPDHFGQKPGKPAARKLQSREAA